MLIYTGIGSQITPDNIQYQMRQIGAQLSKDWVLRTGRTTLADWSFELGAIECSHKYKTEPKMEIILPWHGFNKNLDFTEDRWFNTKNMKLPSDIIMTPTKEMLRVASHFNTNWPDATHIIKYQQMRNICLVAGTELELASDMVVCWTPRSANEQPQTNENHTLSIARYLNIPVFDLALPSAFDDMQKFIAIKTKAYLETKIHLALSSSSSATTTTSNISTITEEKVAINE